jgi:hypothetical protein
MAWNGVGRSMLATLGCIDSCPLTAHDRRELGCDFRAGGFTRWLQQRLSAASGHVPGLALHLDRLVGDCTTLVGALLEPEFVRSRIRAATSAATAGAAPVTMRMTVCDPAFLGGPPGHVCYAAGGGHHASRSGRRR